MASLDGSEEVMQLSNSYYSPADRYVHNAVNNTNPNKNYTVLDLVEVHADYKVDVCPEHVVDFVESRVTPPGPDAFELAKQIENCWRESLMQSLASGVISSKDLKAIGLFIKVDGEFIPVQNVYSHHAKGVVLEL